MDPTYFLKNFDIFGKDDNDNKLEIIKETNIFPNGDWILDLSHYDGAYISYNNELIKLNINKYSSIYNIKSKMPRKVRIIKN